MKALFDDLVYLPDETFSTEVDHALALFGIADNPDLHYSGAAIRRFGRPRPAAVVVSACAPPPSGMRVSFGPRSITRLEVFYEQPRRNVRPPAASIRTSSTPASTAGV